MKLIIFVLTIFCLGVTMEAKAQSSEANSQNDRKILVAYFSWSGNAKALAGQIAQATGGDLFEIKTSIVYPNTYNACTEVAKQEQEKNARPILSGSVENMAQYDIIFLCYPNWWGTLPMGVFTFLEAYDFSAKTIYPLVTHGGSRFGRSLDDIKKLSPKAIIGQGIEISAFDKVPSDSPKVKVPNTKVTSWLNTLGLTK